jgi:hypothetical protein
MYANIDNSPGAAIVYTAPRLDPDKQLYRVTCLSRLLKLISKAREKITYSQRQYDTHSFLSSPFVSRERWQQDVRKWTYITWRLERYYLKKVCELNSMAVEALMGMNEGTTWQTYVDEYNEIAKSLDGTEEYQPFEDLCSAFMLQWDPKSKLDLDDVFKKAGKKYTDELFVKLRKFTGED